MPIKDLPVQGAGENLNRHFKMVFYWYTCIGHLSREKHKYLSGCVCVSLLETVSEKLYSVTYKVIAHPSLILTVNVGGSHLISVTAPWCLFCRVDTAQ